MYEIQINSLIYRLIAIIYLFGMWQNESASKFRKIGRKIIFLIFIVGFPITLFIGAAQTEDKTERLYLWVVAITLCVVNIKAHYGYSENTKQEILEYLENMCVHSVSDEERFKKINKKLKKFKIVCLSIFGMSYGSLVMHLSFSFSFERKLSFNIWFPLDWRKNEINYWVANAYILISGCYGILTVIFTSLIWFLMVNSSIKYQILGDTFRNLGARKVTDEMAMRDLIDGIKMHIKIRSSIEKFASNMSLLFFSQVTTSGISICVSVFLLGFDRSNNISQIVIYVIYALYNLFDIFMIMYFGNEIKLASGKLSYCLFESNWIDQSAPYRKNIIILMELLKQPQELVVGILYPLNLETFMAVLNGAYSMFNILQNIAL